MIVKGIDAWDKRSYHDSMAYNPHMAEIEKEGSSRAFNYSEFQLDVYSSLFKLQPETIPENEVPPEGRWAHKIYSEITQLQEWRTLRERTKLNEEATASACVKFCGDFLDALPKANDRESGGTGVPDPNSLDMSLVRRAARQACAEAAEEADKTNEMLGAFGYGSGDGRPQYASPTMKREIASRLMDNIYLQRIAELAGRFRRIAAEKQKQKTRHGVDELTDIMLGDDLARLVPSELSKLAHPLLKKDFQKRYLEKQLVQYRLRGKEKLGRGPLIICTDESASMRGNPDIWCKAVAMALLQVAQMQKRPFAFIHFDGSVTRVDKFSGKVSPAEVMDSISHFGGGGTNFMEPLNEAIQIIKSDPNFKDADICFITDGDANITEEWLRVFTETKRLTKCNIISILIGVTKSVLERVSDHLFTLDDLTQADPALNTIFSV